MIISAKQESHKVLYYNTCDEILKREAYEQMTNDYYYAKPFLTHPDD